MAFLRLVVTIGLLLGPVCSRAGAQGINSPEAVQAGRELFAVLSPAVVNQTSAQMLTAMWPGIEANVRRAVPDIEARALTELRAEMERLQADLVKEGMEGAPAIYAKYFTAVELRQLTGFYKTPAGAKALELTPQIMAEVMAQIMPRMQQWQGRIQEAMKAVLRKHGHRVP